MHNFKPGDPAVYWRPGDSHHGFTLTVMTNLLTNKLWDDHQVYLGVVPYYNVHFDLGGKVHKNGGFNAAQPQHLRPPFDPYEHIDTVNEQVSDGAINCTEDL